ncbi:MAG: ATP-dependent Zn protease [Myxococcota bacterium]|jgi:ATP-dependent Zn protease
MGNTPTQKYTETVITAYHEAGHAVLALAVGLTVDKVSITAKAGRLGIMQMKGGSKKRRFRDRAEDALLVLLGGIAAEVRLTGAYCTAGATRDLRELHTLATIRAGSRNAASKLAERMFAKANYLLAEPEHWLAVEYIVEDLLQKKDISGRAAKHHFERAMREMG